MPQTTVLPQYKADYPILAKVQKPGGVTVSTTLIATAVPNKPTYVAGTIQLAEFEPPKPPDVREPVEEVREIEEPETEEEAEEETEEEHPHTTRPRGGRGRRGR